MMVPSVRKQFGLLHQIAHVLDRGGVGIGADELVALSSSTVFPSVVV